MDQLPPRDASEIEADAMSSAAARRTAADQDHGYAFDPVIDAIWGTYEQPIDPASADAVPVDFSSANDGGRVSLGRFQHLLRHAEHIAAPNPKVVFYFLDRRTRAQGK